MREGWREVQLGELIDPNRPITYGVVQPGEHDPNGIPLVRGGDFSFGWKPIDDYRRVSPAIERAFSRARLRAGDLVITIKGDVGTAAIVPDFLEGANISQTNARIAVNPSKALAEIVLAFLQSREGRRQISAVTQVGAQPGLIFRDIQGLRLWLPPLPEQRKIAEILRTWDAALEALTTLRTAKARRFEGLRDKLVAAASRVGRPALFGDFLTESREPGTDGATARKISVRLYGKGAVEKIDTRGGSTSTRYYRRKAGQLIWSKLDFLNGAFALLGPELDGYESTLDLPAFDLSDAVNPIWLIEYLTRPTYYTRQIHLARGQRKARRVSPEDWLASPVRLPERELQDRIAEILSTARHELTLLDAEIEALTRQKRGLMQKLLTGEWRVRTGEEKGAAQ
ncbi:restriction endonuclease subunit S [Oceanicella actignis]|uniref:restriction endonuclease subunit S n=1 Tax=Oceanicella actignis TaxID=1189325 RepID=UPI0011E7380C|nr:restriction endonuclease subunit S [Oceanicella actignis]